MTAPARRTGHRLRSGVALVVMVLGTARGAGAQTTLSDGAALPPLPTICPPTELDGPAPQLVDAFGLTTAASADSVPLLAVLLSPPGAYAWVKTVEIRDAALSLPALAAFSPVSDLTWVPLSPPIAVGGTTAQFHVLLTPRSLSHPPAAAAAGPLAVTARIHDFRASSPRVRGDASSTPMRIDATPPPEVRVSAVSADGTSIHLGWTTAARVVVLRRQGEPVTDRPLRGGDYAAGSIGGSTIACAGTEELSSCVSAPLAPGQPHYFRIFSRDACGNYSDGVAVGPIVTMAGGGGTEGDPTPSSRRPVVGLLNPAPGAAMSSGFKVQIRAFSPMDDGGREQPITAAGVEWSGSSAGSAPLSPSARYGTSATSGVWETGAGGLVLATGGYSLRGWATNGSGTVYTGRVGLTVGPVPGDGNLLVRDNSSQLCSDCHAGYPAHGAETLGDAYGSWFAGCRTCHAPHDTPNASLVAKRITPPAVAGQRGPAEIHFSRRTGYAASGGAADPASGSYANGDATGICQACHTRTTRWRSDGAVDAGHVGRCAVCHRHATGFRGECGTCHPTPPATGAHATHSGPTAPTPPFPSDARPRGCGNCHPTDPVRHGDGVAQVVLNPSVLLPGGTTTAGALATRRTTGISCLVACHYPLGASARAQRVAWGATGPLPCTSCHTRIAPGGAVPTPRAGPSLHDPIFSEARPASGEPTTCYSCHDPAAHDATHLTGAPGLHAGGSVDATCIACHSPPSGPAAGPPGQVLHAGADAAGSKTPPHLVGWSAATVDAASGDFHGGRRGTCFGPYGPAPCAPSVTPTGHGGTLKAPYYRGYPAIPCATCHAGHASGNAFLLADAVNGTPIPAGSIDRTGAGAERLCDACHEGGRHDRCRECHTDAYYCDENAQCWMDGAANHIDPAPPGSACFVCHGHEGIVKWTSPYGPHGDPPTDCRHCHGGIGANGGSPVAWVPPKLDPPKLPYGPPVVSAITTTSATLTWRTDVNASTWVEYGVGMPGYVAGSAAETWDHAVTLVGLQPGTTYVWRLRSVDGYRNVLRTPLATFRTTPAGGVPYPDVVPVGWTGVVQPESTMGLGLTWYPVAASSGNPVQYRVQLASDPGFTTLVNGTPRDSGWIPGTPGTRSGREVRSFGVTLTNLPADWCVDPIPYNAYYWRVKARDAVTGVESEWSAVDAFQATSFDPVGC